MVTLDTSGSGGSELRAVARKNIFGSRRFTESKVGTEINMKLLKEGFEFYVLPGTDGPL